LNEVDPDQLRETVESQHGGRATLVQAVPVRDEFQGQAAWEGVVHVFMLEDHPMGHARLRLVHRDRRGDTEAPLLCRAARWAGEVSPGCGARGYRGGSEALANVCTDITRTVRKETLCDFGGCDLFATL
jgi:hypothetical protein